MPRLTGGPNRAFPSTGSVIHSPSTPPVSVPIPDAIKVPAEDDLIAPGEVVNYEANINLKVVKVQCDIPAGVDAWIELNGRRIHSITDKQGNVGSLEVGDMAAGIGIDVRSVKAHFESFLGEMRCARYYLVGTST